MSIPVSQFIPPPSWPCDHKFIDLEVFLRSNSQTHLTDSLFKILFLSLFSPSFLSEESVEVSLLQIFLMSAF